MRSSPTFRPPHPENATRPLLAVYFPLGDPEVSIGLIDVYAENHVDVVEFGWPARDPYLDGPDVRGSMARASGGDSRRALRAALRRLAGNAEAPRALLMTYAESDHPALADTALLGGLNAVLVVGSPSDPSRIAIEARAREAGAAVCVFAPLPIADEDVAAARCADGYVMLQAAPGVTGPRSTLDPANRESVARLRGAGIVAPIVLGFGVSRGEHARAAVGLGANGIVVGSAALRAAREGRAALDALLRELREGLDG